MAEATDAQTPPHETVGNPPDPIGDVIIGDADPRTLTRDEFSSSSQLLFHGSADKFDFFQDFEISFGTTMVNSHKLGPGFYAVNNRYDAEAYSESFDKKRQEPVVTEILPFQARMFDFRQKDDITHNATVPDVMFREYKEFAEQYFDRKYENYDPQADADYVKNAPKVAGLPTGNMVEDYFPNWNYVDSDAKQRAAKLSEWSDSRKYRSTLNRLSQSNGVYLREMTSASGNEDSSEYAGSLFKDFITGKGFDGIIYIEGGDNRVKHKNPISYVFYNLKTIGTYETYHEAETTTRAEDLQK